MSLVLSVCKLRKAYPGKGQQPAVDEISFELKGGEILGLLGPNGSGKTTTIQMLLGTLTPTSGSIVYFGKDFTSHRTESLQHISFASAYSSLPYLLTIEENLEIFGRLYGLNPRESATKFIPLLDRFGILDKKKKRLSSLSAGQVTRLMLVKAFFMGPKVVLLDEPTASLDPDIAQEICQFILEERSKTGLSILFTSHKMGEATLLCDRVIFLQHGKIIANDTPQKIAQTVSSHRLKFIIVDGMQRTIDLVERRRLAYKTENRAFTITLEEKEIPSFLYEMMQAQVVYTDIKIEEPSLDDFFLQIARKPS